MNQAGWLRELVAAAGEVGVVSVPTRWLRELLQALDAPPAPTMDLTCDQVAALLGRRPSTIRGWCAEGRFPQAYRLHAREWRIPPSAVTAMQERARLGQDARSDVAPDLGAWRRVRGSR